MTSDSAEKYLRAWLESSGAALELRVASSLMRRIGSEAVDHAHYYVDADAEGAQQLREIDIVARLDQYPQQLPEDKVVITLVIECKSSNRHPWALFTSSDNLVHIGGEFAALLPNRIMRSGVSMSQLDTHGRELLAPVGDQLAYQVVQAKESGNERNVAWDAVRQVLDAVTALEAEPIATQTAPAIMIYVPIIITASPLYAVSLDSSGELRTTEVTRKAMVASIRTHTPPRLGRIGYARADAVGLWVVHESAADDFLQMALQNARDVRLSE